MISWSSKWTSKTSTWRFLMAITSLSPSNGSFECGLCASLSSYCASDVCFGNLWITCETILS